MSQPPKPKRPAPDWASLPVSGGSLNPLDPIQGVNRIRPVSSLRTGHVSERAPGAYDPHPSTPDDATHLNQVAHVLARAQEKLGSEAAALAWLKTPLPALDGLAPLHVMPQASGLGQVLQLLDKMKNSS